MTSQTITIASLLKELLTVNIFFASQYIVHLDEITT